MYFQMKNFVEVREPEGTLVFQLEDLMRYSGPRGLIASGVTMKLLDRAFKDLSPREPPMRHEIYILSSFPGSDVVDGFELVTRAVTRGRYILDLDKAPKDAPPSPAGGSMYFEIGYRDRCFAYTLSPEIFDKEWFEAVAAKQEGCKTEKEHANYLAYTFSVLGKLIASSDPFLRIEPCKLDERFSYKY